MEFIVNRYNIEPLDINIGTNAYITGIGTNISSDINLLDILLSLSPTIFSEDLICKPNIDDAALAINHICIKINDYYNDNIVTYQSSTNQGYHKMIISDTVSNDVIKKIKMKLALTNK